MATFDDLIRAVEATGERIIEAIEGVREDLDRVVGAVADVGEAGGGGDGADAAVTGASPGKAGGEGAAAALAGRGAAGAVGAAALAVGAAAKFLDRPVQMAAATGEPADVLAGINFKLEQMGARVPVFNTLTGLRTEVLSREAAISDVSDRFAALAAAGLEVSDESIVRSSRIAFERNERALRMRDRVAGLNVREHGMRGALGESTIEPADGPTRLGRMESRIERQLDELIRVTKENKMGGSPGIK